MNRFVTTVVTAAGAILLAGTLAAAQTAPAHGTPKGTAGKSASSMKAAKAAPVSGEIVKADATSVTVKTKKGEESFAVNSDTKITQAGKSLTSSELAAGEMATVSYTKSGDQMTATRIAVRPAAKKSAHTEKTPKAPKSAKK